MVQVLTQCKLVVELDSVQDQVLLGCPQGKTCIDIDTLVIVQPSGCDEFVRVIIVPIG